MPLRCIYPFSQAYSVGVAFLAACNVVAGAFRNQEEKKFLLLPEPSSDVGGRDSEAWKRELEK